MHAGVLPGYPASHGCIRMPMAFAAKMWNWTKMGARVIVTPGELTPVNFSHPLLVAQRVAPQPVIADDPKSDAPAIKSDKGADARPATKPAEFDVGLELRSTLGHVTQTADASGAMPAAVTMSDALPSSNPMPASSEAVAASTEVKPEAQISAETVASDSKPSEQASTETRAPETVAAEVKPADDTATEAKPELTASQSMTIEDKLAETKSDEAPAESKSAEAASDDVKTGTVEITRVDAPAAEAVKATEPKAAETPAEPAKAVADTPDAKKDPSRLPGAEKAVVAKPELPKRTGQIAVFVSRKDSKLYVRQNFAPLFDVPVTIAPSTRMLGTHVFTAQADKTDSNLLRWSVVSLPVTARNAAVTEEDERAARRRKVAGGAPAEARPAPEPNSPAEALDRITVPPEAMARIAEAMSMGGSIIVSDQGINQGETGEGTDFIVSLR
jgi:L,D-transpeptidase catalytic domain